MFFIVENLLNFVELDNVKRLLSNGVYLDGLVTAKTGHDVKKNLELKIDDIYVNVVQIIEKSIDMSEKVNNRLFPRARTLPIINRYDVGMYYREHVDFPLQGGNTQTGRTQGRFGQNFVRTDYSMTLFLTSPEDYDGGELDIHIGESIESIKLPAGSAVFYQTGIPHSVRTVSRGSRICAVSWFQSLVRDPNLRRTLWDLYNVEQLANGSKNQQLIQQLQSVRFNLVRYLADV